MNRWFLSFLVIAPLVCAPAAAQPPGAGGGIGERLPAGRGGLRGGPGSRRIEPVNDSNAQETQRRLQELLRQYPPSLGRVLALDPTLVGNTAYLEPYPQLAAFLEQHPEIAHNPSFFFDQQFRELSRPNNDYNVERAHSVGEIAGMFEEFAGLTAAVCFVLIIAWLIKQLIEHRKWLRVSATHVQTHTKLMDRLTSNEDLIAYMQSPAGRRFLEAAPIPLEAAPRTLGAPFTRILWSMQAGVVVAALGVGLMFASRHLGSSDLFSDGQIPMLIIGIAAIAIGIGFLLSAVAAYGLSHRLGLIQPPAPDTPGSQRT